MLLALFVLLAAGADDELHRVVKVPADARISVENASGSIRVTGWDRNEVKIDAVKSGTADEKSVARIEVDEGPFGVRIRTRLPEGTHNPARVEYTIMAPRGARIDEIKLASGDVTVEGITGAVNATVAAGRIAAKGMRGDARLSSVSGSLDAAFEALNGVRRIELKTVSGPIDLLLPADASAEIDAGNVSGGVHNDFGLAGQNAMVGGRLRGKLGSGGTQITIKSVSGTISISPVSGGKRIRMM